MNRRKFLIGSAGVLATSVVFRRALGQGAPPGVAADPANASVAGRLSIAPGSPSHLVPENFTGLSYELAQLTDPGFFAAGNRELVALFRLLSPQGVLRVGGNSSESCWLKVEPTTTAPELPPVSGPVSEHWMPRQLFMIPPESIDELAGFMRATGWQLIYGLNFGHSSPDRLAREAEFVASRVHGSLLYFQIGNEPDLYSTPTNRTRPPGWGFDDYLREWTACADAISQRVPDAKFGGPDVARSSKWITQFIPAAATRLGPRLVAASGHYYAEGPPDDPRVTTEQLLRTNPEIGGSAKMIADLAARNGLVYRLTEGNSCYRGGKPGMSDALASALWGGDYLLSLAEAGCAGVNLHGGSRSVLRAALGNHMPGELVAKPGSDSKGGFYTPIAGEIGQGFSVRPLFYGMLLANQFAGTRTGAVVLSTGGIDATAYAGRGRDGWRVAIFNKDSSRKLALTIEAPPQCRAGRAWRLVGPSLDATTGVSLAGAEVGPDLTWSPRTVENRPVADGRISLDVPSDSAALLFLDA
jgi:hypothetical protein